MYFIAKIRMMYRHSRQKLPQK